MQNQYSLNGNILSLSLSGKIGTGTNYDMIDELTYGYNGNQLKKVDDIDDDNYQDNGFSDNDSFGNNEYAYDANGNMIQDDNKDMDITEYNYLNLQQQITIK